MATAREDYERRLLTIESIITNLQAHHKDITSRIQTLEKDKNDLEYDYKVARIRRYTSATEWIKNRFNWSEKIQQILKEKFDFDYFRWKQLAAINATLSKKDVLLLMPAGSGKTLVYELAALIDQKVTLIVTTRIPSIADQFITLGKLGIESVTINDSFLIQGSKKISNDLIIDENWKPRLMYITPEWLTKNKVFMNYIKDCFLEKLDRVVIDEVHRCCAWGLDYGPDYQGFQCFKKWFPDVPILGLTTTSAPMKMLFHLETSLNLRDPLMLASPFNRHNIFYEVINKPDEIKVCMDTIAYWLETKYMDQSGIIYVSTTYEREQFTKYFKDREFLVEQYHAQMERLEKKIFCDRWMSNQYQVIVTNIAFEPGMDKPDVRFVIHHTVPKTLDDYYEETATAGGDGKDSDCILMFSLSDYATNACMAITEPEKINSRNMLSYCLEQVKCRRELLAQHFKEEWTKMECSDMCDRCNCLTPLLHFDIMPAFRDLVCLIEAANNLEIKLTVKTLVAAWLRSDPTKLVDIVKKQNCSKPDAEQIVGFLILNGYLLVERDLTVEVTPEYIEIYRNAIPSGTVPVGSIVMPSRSKLEYNQVEPPVLETESHPVEVIKEPAKKRRKVQFNV